MKRTFVIALSGGPCAGKTCSLPFLKEELEKMGFLVFVVQEAATELINNGATYKVCNGAIGFQTSVLELQLARENLFKRLAKNTNFSNKSCIILCDRGAVDCLAYLSDEEKSVFLKLNHTSHAELLNRYDAVFHMISVAMANKDAYSFESNEARFETLDEAILSEKKLSNVWKSHNHYYIIDYEHDFLIKVANLSSRIRQYLEKQM